MGVYPGFQPEALPATPGLEGCGVIADANGTGLENGKRGVVFFNTKEGQGSWQEYVTVPQSNFLPVPDSCSTNSAAQFFVNPVTVYGMLDILNAPKGEYILQSAAGSVLGRQLICMAKLRGLKTINLVRRGGSAITELLDIGADYVIDTSEEDVVARVKEITNGNGAYGAIDAVAGDLTSIITGSVRAGGTVLIYGAMGGLEFKGSVVDTLFRQVNISGFWLNVWLGTLSNQKKTAVFTEIIDMLSDGRMTPLSGESFDLNDVVKAVAHSQIPARGGKVIISSN
jgi:NADPH:quinone reductase-like Zn-dependent oxidoreductase